MRGAGPVVLAQSVSRLASRLTILLLRGYQAVLSPMFAALGSQCRFEPSCSQYMIEAVQARGVVVGLGLGIWRVLRCNPFNSGGYDPAPSAQETSRGQDVSRETI